MPSVPFTFNYRYINSWQCNKKRIRHKRYWYVAWKTAKLAKYADGISIYNLINIQDKFESVSGLNLKQSKSERLWLGSLRLHKLDETLNLKLTDEPIYALAILFLKWRAWVWSFNVIVWPCTVKKCTKIIDARLIKSFTFVTLSWPSQQKLLLETPY